MKRSGKAQSREHVFDVGERVRMRASRLQPSAASGFTVLRRMPVEHNMPLYRIKGDGERHERIAAEGQLELLPPDELKSLFL